MRGIVKDTHYEYLEKDMISRGLLVEIDRSPSVEHVISKEWKDKPHLDVGTAVHIATLEPHLFDSQVIKGPADRRGKKWSDPYAEAKKKGITLLTEGDYENVLRIKEAFDPYKDILDGAQTELSVYTEILGVPVKARADAIKGNELFDVKTTQLATPEEFSKSVYKYGYHVQAAFYMDLFNLEREEKVDKFCFIAIEKSAPYTVGIYYLDDRAIELGRDIYMNSLIKYKDYLTLPKNEHKKAVAKTIDLPDYAYEEKIELPKISLED